MAKLPASASVNRPQPMRVLLVKALTYALLVFWSLVCLFPLYWVAVTSLKGDPEIMRGPYYLPFVDFAPSLDTAHRTSGFSLLSSCRWWPPALPLLGW
jgi:multiple sugar transport system permease protein